MVNYDLGDFDEKKVKEIAAMIYKKCEYKKEKTITPRERLEELLEYLYGIGYTLDSSPYGTYYRDVDIENKLDYIISELEQILKEI